MSCPSVYRTMVAATVSLACALFCEFLGGFGRAATQNYVWACYDFRGVVRCADSWFSANGAGIADGQRRPSS